LHSGLCLWITSREQAISSHTIVVQPRSHAQPHLAPYSIGQQDASVPWPDSTSACACAITDLGGVVATAPMQCLVGRPVVTLIELNKFCFGLHPMDRPAMDGNAISAYTRHTPKLVYSCCFILIAVRAGRWHLFFAEFLNNCDLNSWGTNSVVAHGVSDTPSGPYRRVGVVQPAFHHNPTVA
jgi:hypothetical protein